MIGNRGEISSIIADTVTVFYNGKRKICTINTKMQRSVYAYISNRAQEFAFFDGHAFYNQRAIATEKHKRATRAFTQALYIISHKRKNDCNFNITIC
jgi:hypothetical protein